MFCTSQKGKIESSCLTIWYLRAFGGYKYWTAARCQRSYNGRYVQPDTQGKIPSFHECVEGKGPWVRLRFVIHCSEGSLWKPPASSDKKSPPCFGARPARPRTIANHCERLNHNLPPCSYQHAGLTWSKCWCVCGGHGKSIFSIPDNSTFDLSQDFCSFFRLDR